MKKSTLIIIGLIILAIIILIFAFSGSKDVTTEPEGDGAPAKPTKENIESSLSGFEFPNYDGELIRFADFNNKIIVANAWASWCPFCVNELPDFGELQKAFPDDVVVIAINRAEPTSTAKSFSDKLGLSDDYFFLVDPDDSFYKKIGGFSMPETLFINTNGDISLHKRGPMKFDEMKTIVEGILAGE